MSGPADSPAGETRCGFIAIIGASNVGKSTLLNSLVGSKVAIVTPRVQTTRTRVLGIALNGPVQMVFVDTPGIFEPRRRLDRAMVAAAWSGAADADLVLLLVDAAKPKIGPDTWSIVDRLKAGGRSVMLALNKTDAAPKSRLLEFTAQLNERLEFAATYMISAKTGDGLDRLRDDFAARLPRGPWLYPEDEITDMPLRLMAAEITREQVFLRLRDELPYATMVETETWETRDDGSVRIAQVIYVQRPGHRGIVLGNKGSMIKAIGSGARAEMEQIMDGRVHLSLFVKVQQNWADDRGLYRDWGLDYNV